MEDKKRTSKGINDSQLAAKYESGKFNLGKVIKSTLVTSVKPPTKKK